MARRGEVHIDAVGTLAFDGPDSGTPMAAEETIPARCPITVRDLLTFTLGTGIVPAEPGTVPIADALNALQGDEPGQPPDEWIARLRSLPLVCHRASAGCTTPPPT